MNDEEALALVLGDAKGCPMVFIEALTRRLLAHPDGRNLLADALRDMAERDLQEAEALEAENGAGAEIIQLKPTT